MLTKIYEEGHAHIFPMHLFAEPWAWRLSDKAGEQLTSITLVFRNGGGEWYTEETQQTRVAKLLLSRMLEGDFEHVRDTTLRLLEEVERHTSAMESSDFRSWDSGRLVAEYQKYCDMLLDLNSWGTLVTLMEMGHESVISSAVYEYMRQRGLAVGELEAAISSIGDLCAPAQGTFLRQKRIQEIELAIIADREGMASPLPRAGLESLHKRFCWVSYGYIGPEMALADFEGEVSHFLKAGNLSAELSRAKGEEESTRKRHAELESHFKFDAYGKRLLDIARTFMYQKEFRKQVLYHSFYALVPMRKELAGRAGVSLELLGYVLPRELGQVVDGKMSAEELGERKKLCVYLPYERKMLTGKPAEDYLSNLSERPGAGSNGVLKGQTTFAAKTVEGTVRIVRNSHDLSKMAKGEILVSPATSPVMVPAMRIASAIVTDQGGITCHAAIVSRELGIPCIVGTKVATQSLNDGDRVRVDTLAGTVTKL